MSKEARQREPGWVGDRKEPGEYASNKQLGQRGEGVGVTQKMGESKKKT